MKNAFNEMSRASVIEALEKESGMQHLAWFAAIVLAPPSGLETGGEMWGDSEEGATQGDPAAGPFFCVSWQEEVRELDRAVATVGGLTKFGMDDGYVLGPPHVVFPALEKFARDVRGKCLLQWEKTKTEVFTWQGILPTGTTPGLTSAGITIDDKFEPGFMCYGVPVGTDKYVRHMLGVKVEQVAEDAEKVVSVLKDEKQALWAILRSSLSQQLDYWLQLCYPSDVEYAARRMDSILWKVLQVSAGSSIARGRGHNTDLECILDVPVDGLRGKTFQEWAVSQPVRMGGIGIGSQLESSPIAFI